MTGDKIIYFFCIIMIFMKKFYFHFINSSFSHNLKTGSKISTF